MDIGIRGTASLTISNAGAVLGTLLGAPFDILDIYTGGRFQRLGNGQRVQLIVASRRPTRFSGTLYVGPGTPARQGRWDTANLQRRAR